MLIFVHKSSYDFRLLLIWNLLCENVHTAHRWYIIRRARSGSYLVAKTQNNTRVYTHTVNIMVKINSILCINEPGTIHSRSFGNSSDLAVHGLLQLNFLLLNSTYEPTEQSFVTTSQKCFWNEHNDAGHLICMLCSNFVATGLPVTCWCVLSTVPLLLLFSISFFNGLLYACLVLSHLCSHQTAHDNNGFLNQL